MKRPSFVCTKLREMNTHLGGPSFFAVGWGHTRSLWIDACRNSAAIMAVTLLCVLRKTSSSSILYLLHRRRSTLLPGSKRDA